MEDDVDWMASSARAHPGILTEQRAASPVAKAASASTPLRKTTSSQYTPDSAVWGALASPCPWEAGGVVETSGRKTPSHASPSGIAGQEMAERAAAQSSKTTSTEAARQAAAAQQAAAEQLSAGGRPGRGGSGRGTLMKKPSGPRGSAGGGNAPPASDKRRASPAGATESEKKAKPSGQMPQASDGGGASPAAGARGGVADGRGAQSSRTRGADSRGSGQKASGGRGRSSQPLSGRGADPCVRGRKGSRGRGRGTGRGCRGMRKASAPRADASSEVADKRGAGQTIKATMAKPAAARGVQRPESNVRAPGTDGQTSKGARGPASPESNQRPETNVRAPESEGRASERTSAAKPATFAGRRSTDVYQNAEVFEYKRQLYEEVKERAEAESADGTLPAGLDQLSYWSFARKYLQENMGPLAGALPEVIKMNLAQAAAAYEAGLREF